MMAPVGGVRLRHALRADLPAIAELWVDAFAGDPFLRWIEPDDSRWPAFARPWMLLVAERAFERGHTYRSDPLDVAAAWIPPDLSLLGPSDVERRRSIIAAHAGEAGAEDAMATIAAARADGIDVAHWSLQYLGVRSTRYGRGLGAVAIAPMLARCDDEGWPCGLLSSNGRNIAFYARHGFRVTNEVTTGDGAAVLRPMARAPAA